MPLAQAFADILQTALSTREAIQLVDSRPDVLHLFGNPTVALCRRAHRLYLKKIPYLYSPLGALLPWQADPHPALKSLLREATALVVYGETEKNVLAQRLRRRKSPPPIYQVQHPATAVRYTPADLAAQMEEIYRHAADAHEQKMRAEIRAAAEKITDDEPIRSFFSQLLYYKYQDRRDDIRPETLQQLHRAFMADNFDEDKVCELINEHKLKKIALQAQQQLADETGLTEGFMLNLK